MMTNVTDEDQYSATAEMLQDNDSRGGLRIVEDSPQLSPDEVSGEHTETFPFVLHRMLEDASATGFDNIVSWLPSGNGFKVHDREAFQDEIMGKYFEKQTKYKSFLRQLNFYGFNRVACGAQKGHLHHKFFKRGIPSLCTNITREKRQTTSRLAAESIQRQVKDSRRATGGSRQQQHHHQDTTCSLGGHSPPPPCPAHPLVVQKNHAVNTNWKAGMNVLARGGLTLTVADTTTKKHADGVLVRSSTLPPSTCQVQPHLSRDIASEIIATFLRHSHD